MPACHNQRWRNPRDCGNSPLMKLQQNQVWRQGERYLRIVQLDRMTVDYKLMQAGARKEGSHHHAKKKEFCRLLKGATLVSPADMLTMVADSPPGDEGPAALAEPPDAALP